MSARSSEVFSPFLQDPKTTACFSGHRPEKLPFNINNYLNEEHYLSLIYLHIHNAYLAGYRTFITGMARGFDILAAIAVIRYQHRFSVNEKINLIGVSPYAGETDHLYSQDLFDYNFVKDRCDDMIYLNREYHRGCFHQRNRFMVDHSSLLISSCIDENSGTGSTVRYAHKKGLQVDNISLKDFPVFTNADCPLPQCGYWVIDSGRKGTVKHIKANHPFSPVNDTSDKEKKQ